MTTMMTLSFRQLVALKEPSIEGRRMELGEHLTGWVAANGRPMMNSEAALDLAVLAPDASTVLNLCLSVPLFDESECLIGVLSAYSGQPFTTDQLDTACLLATSIASALSVSSVDLPRSTPAGSGSGPRASTSMALPRSYGPGITLGRLFSSDSKVRVEAYVVAEHLGSPSLLCQLDSMLRARLAQS